MLARQEHDLPFLSPTTELYVTQPCGSGIWEWLAWMVLAGLLRGSSVRAAAVQGLHSSCSSVRAAGGPSSTGRLLGVCWGTQTCLIRRKGLPPSSEYHHSLSSGLRLFLFLTLQDVPLPKTAPKSSSLCSRGYESGASTPKSGPGAEEVRTWNEDLRG